MSSDCNSELYNITSSIETVVVQHSTVLNRYTVYVLLVYGCARFTVYPQKRIYHHSEKLLDLKPIFFSFYTNGV